jgi:hypothetical protein
MFDPMEMSQAISHLAELAKKLAPAETKKITLGVRPDEDFVVFSFHHRAQCPQETGGTDLGGDYSEIKDEIIKTVKKIKEMYKGLMVWNTMGLTVKDGCPYTYFDARYLMTGTQLPKEEILNWALSEFKTTYEGAKNDDGKKMDPLHESSTDASMSSTPEKFKRIKDEIFPFLLKILQDLLLSLSLRKR